MIESAATRRLCRLLLLSVLIVGEGSMSADDRMILWDTRQPVPKSAECAGLEGVRFYVIQPRDPAADSYNWLHGVAIVHHQDRVLATFGHNVGVENTAGEVVNGRTSADGGRTWGPLFSLANSGGDNAAVSHGVLLSRGDQLWAFQGAFTGRLTDVHMRAFTRDDSTERSQPRGVVCRDGFFPMQQPLQMEDGNWIIAGLQVREGIGQANNPAAVAISRGDDLLHWDAVPIVADEGLELWGESTILIDGSKLLCISRWRKPVALAATSDDFGRSWTTLRETNLPMSASKPYAGRLSNGSHYLVGTTTSDAGNRRAPLTIALTRQNEWTFCKIFQIRDAIHEGPGESGPKVRLSYPYAIEHDGHLYVGYSNDGGRGQNRNSAELAVIPLDSLQVDE